MRRKARAKTSKPPLGTGERFRQLVAELSKRPGIKDPEALAAAIGRRKYGTKTMAALAASGRKRNPWTVVHQETVVPADDLRDAHTIAKRLVAHYGGSAQIQYDGKLIKLVRSRKKNPPERTKRNPDELEQAASLTEAFHGRPARSVRALEETIEVRDILTELGELTELEAELPDGRIALITAPGARVLASPDGSQLYLAGGDQSLQTEALGLEPKDLMVVGQLNSITYRTRKAMDAMELVDYHHEFGEETGDRPTLLYDRLNTRLIIAGGEYQILPEGIVN